VKRLKRGTTMTDNTAKTALDTMTLKEIEALSPAERTKLRNLWGIGPSSRLRG
jgi:hypothetical protein